MNDAVHAAHPDVQTIAEESTSWPMVSRPTFAGGLEFGLKLDRRMKGKNIAFVAVSPGWVPETAAASMSSRVQRFLFKHILWMLPLARTPKQGSDNTVYAATDAAVASGSYIEDQKPGVLSDDARDQAEAKRLWEESCRWTGIETYGVA